MNDLNLNQGPQLHIANIGTNERRKRRNFGIATLVVGFVLAAVLLLTGAPWWTRLVLFFPFAGGWSGILQAKDST